MTLTNKSTKTFKSYKRTHKEHKEGAFFSDKNDQGRITTQNDTEETLEVNIVEETHENTKKKQPKNLIQRLGLFFSALKAFIIHNFFF